jgi:SAM-dependent methyltransferase
MKNEDTLKFFQQMADTSNSPNSVKLAKNSDFSHLDAAFIMKYADENSTILDLASGTGLIINKIFDKTGHITAVEPMEGFTKFIAKTDKINVIHENIFNYKNEKLFDLITLFGIMHYFNEIEATKIYEKYFNYLDLGAKIIVKNQFGVKEDVLVSGYSEELKSNYYANYRHIDKEVQIMENIGYKNIEVIDLYPAECNRWENTHFLAIVAAK